MGVNSETTPETDIAGTLSQNTGSQIMRDKLHRVIRNELPATKQMDDIAPFVTDAAIAALPDMVVPLMWVDHPLNGEPVLSRALVQGGGYFICDDTDDFTGAYLAFVSCDDVCWWQHVRSTSIELQSHFHDDDVAPLKAAAQAHHAAQALSAFGITPPSTREDT